MKRTYAMVLVLIGKWGLAAALLFALTLPFTTCQTRGGVQEHHVELTMANAWTIFCFAWPVPILLARTFWRKMREAYPLVIVECVLDVIAWIWLTLSLFGAQVISLGGIKPGRGYEIASAALLGYLLFSGFDLAMLLRRPAAADATP